MLGINYKFIITAVIFFVFLLGYNLAAITSASTNKNILIVFVAVIMFVLIPVLTKFKRKIFNVWLVLLPVTNVLSINFSGKQLDLSSAVTFFCFY